MTKPIDATKLPRRSIHVQAVIEELQRADDMLRNGQDITAQLIAVEACIMALFDFAKNPKGTRKKAKP